MLIVAFIIRLITSVYHSVISMCSSLHIHIKTDQKTIMNIIIMRMLKLMDYII